MTALPVAEFRRARTLAMSQPTAPAHGDLNEGNALWDAGDGVVRLIDFEYVGAYPWAGTRSTYWVHLPDAEQRALLLDLVLGIRTALTVGASVPCCTGTPCATWPTSSRRFPGASRSRPVWRSPGPGSTRHGRWSGAGQPRLSGVTRG